VLTRIREVKRYRNWVICGPGFGYKFKVIRSGSGCGLDFGLEDENFFRKIENSVVWRNLCSYVRII